jgi:hypothetical protein
MGEAAMTIKPEKLIRVTVAKGLSKKGGLKAVWNAAKRKGKRDARSIGYDPKTGKGHAL